MAFLRRTILWLTAALALGGRARREPGAARPPPLRKVMLQTDWFPQAEHGGYSQALARGYYRQAGLDVALLPGGPGAGITLKTARGDADFGMLNSDDIIVAASRGLPLVMIMATMQHDPQTLMVCDDSPVRTLRDIDGRTIIASPGMTSIPYVQKKCGIRFNLTPHNYGIAMFIANPEAIQQCVVTNEPSIAHQAGKKVRMVSLAEMILRNLEKGEDVGQLSLTRLAEVAQTLVQLGVIGAPVAIASVATKDCHRPGGRNRRRLISVCHEP